MPQLPRGLVEAHVVHEYSGHIQRNVLHFLPLGDWSDVSAGGSALSEGLKRWWTEPFGGAAAPSSFQGDHASFLSTILLYVPVPGPLGPLFRLVIDWAILTLTPSPPVPANVSFCFRLETEGPFRRASGRFYFPWLSRENIDQGDGTRMHASRVPLMRDALSQLEPSLNDFMAPSRGVEHVVWLRSRQVGGPLAMPVSQRVVRWVAPSLTLASQYGRLRRTHRDRPRE